jgi:hypothetical protein
MRTAPRFTAMGGNELRAEWGTQRSDGVVAFQPKGEGVVLEYVRVRPGYPHSGARLFADALKYAGITRPKFIESTPILNTRMLNQIRSGNLDQAQRAVRVQALTLASELGATVKVAEVVQTAAGNWIARVELSY